MKAKDIKVGEEYAVGRPSNARWADFRDRWPGERVRVVAVGQHGKVRGHWHDHTSSKPHFAEVEFLEPGKDPYTYRCPLDANGRIQTRGDVGERTVYRVPYKDVLAPWGEYAEQRAAARKAQDEAEARDEARREERAESNRKLRNRLVALGILEPLCEEVFQGRDINLSRRELERLVDLAERSER